MRWKADILSSVVPSVPTVNFIGHIGHLGLCSHAAVMTNHQNKPQYIFI